MRHGSEGAGTTRLPTRVSVVQWNQILVRPRPEPPGATRDIGRTPSFSLILSFANLQELAFIADLISVLQQKEWALVIW